MNFERSSHGICFAYDSIFVVGGSSNDDNICLDKCERFDFS